MEEKRITIRTTEDFHKRIEQSADDHHRSLNSEILVILETYFSVDKLRWRIEELERHPPSLD